jgi:hypothetical protein
VIDRSVVVRMRRRSPGETIQPLRRRRVVTETARLARRIAAWCHRSAEALDGVDPVMPVGITDRPADTWEPLLVVADAAGGDWPARARAACVKLNKVRAEADDSIGGKLLADIPTMFDGADRMSSAALAEKLAGIEEAPWGDWRGKPIDARWLAGKLRPFGVAPKAVRIGDTTPRGYTAEDFHDVWARYLPSPSATSATSATPLASPVADVADVALPDGGNGQHAAPPDVADALDLLTEAFGPLDPVAANPGELSPIDRNDGTWF